MKVLTYEKLIVKLLGKRIVIVIKLVPHFQFSIHSVLVQSQGVWSTITRGLGLELREANYE
jgi:hypothetical protein